MPRPATPITQQQLNTLKPRETRYRIFDGRGLVLQVETTGRMTWKFRKTDAGRVREAVIGTYPEMSLAAARQYVERHANSKEPMKPIERRIKSDAEKIKRGERRLNVWISPETNRALHKLTGGSDDRGALKAAIEQALIDAARRAR